MFFNGPFFQGKKNVHRGNEKRSRLGDASMPEKIMRLPQKGPKYGVQPGVSAHGLIEINRKVTQK